MQYVPKYDDLGKRKKTGGEDVGTDKRALDTFKRSLHFPPGWLYKKMHPVGSDNPMKEVEPVSADAEDDGPV